MSAAVLALVLYLAGLLAVFGWRSLALRRRTGDAGLRLRAGPVWSVGWWAKLLFLAALLLGAAGPASGLSGVDPLSWLDSAAARVAGGVLAVAGIAATLAAQSDMGTSWRVGVDAAERTRLVTTGAFGLVRNPVFSAMVLGSAGIALLVPNVVSLAATAVLVASIEPQVRAIEEPYLLRTHGPAYEDYARRVGRFIPRLGTLSRSSTPA